MSLRELAKSPDRQFTSAYNELVRAVRQLQKINGTNGIHVALVGGVPCLTLSANLGTRVEYLEVEEDTPVGATDKFGVVLNYDPNVTGDESKWVATEFKVPIVALESALTAGTRAAFFQHKVAGKFVPIEGGEKSLWCTLDDDMPSSDPVKTATTFGAEQTLEVSGARVLRDGYKLEAGATVFVVYDKAAQPWFVVQSKECPVEV